jgi:hypothetical protein
MSAYGSAPSTACITRTTDLANTNTVGPVTGVREAHTRSHGRTVPATARMNMRDADTRHSAMTVHLGRQSLCTPQPGATAVARAGRSLQWRPVATLGNAAWCRRPVAGVSRRMRYDPQKYWWS